MIATTNAIESLNARFRRSVKARGHFPNEQAALKHMQARAVRQRRHAGLAELRFATLEQYVQDRYLTRGWPLPRLYAELEVGHQWIATQLRQLGLRE